MTTGTGGDNDHAGYIPRAQPGRGLAIRKWIWCGQGLLLITTGEIPASGEPLVPLRELRDDRLLDALLDRSRDEAGGCG